MKKVLALVLALSMLAVLVPSFIVSAADAPAAVPTEEEAIAGKTMLTAYSGSSDNAEDYGNTIDPGVQVWSGATECCFLDGNVYFADAEAKAAITALSDEDLTVYVNGKSAAMAPNHSGISTSGVGGGVQLAVIKAGFVTGEENTVTIVLGDTGYYTQFIYTSTFTSLHYDSAEAIVKGPRATITVTGADVAAAYSVGEKVDVRLHDDHNDRLFTVTAIDGDKVVFSCDDFASTTKTLVEIGYATDTAVCVLLTENYAGGTLPAPEEGELFYAAYQTRTGATAGSDIRYIFSADEMTLAKGYLDGTSLAQNAKVTLTFKKGDAVVKKLTLNFSDLEYMYFVKADNEYYGAAEDNALFGFIVRNVPTFAWTSQSVAITLGEETLYEAGTMKPIEEIVALGGYVWIDGEENMAADQGNGSVGKLFDRDGGQKYEAGNVAGATVTWNYAEPKTVSLYALTAAGDTASYKTTLEDGTIIYNRTAQSWTFYGSTNGTDWVIIDQQDAPNLVVEGGQSSFYEVNDPQAYQYYKIELVASGGWFQLGEMKLYEVASTATYNFNNTINGATNLQSTPAASFAHEGLTQLFDGDSGSKFGYYSSTNKVVVTWEYSTAQTATGYSITTANDSTRFGRNPTSWVLYGSTDGAEWHELDSVTAGGNFSNEIVMYGIDNPTAYQYYKIEFEVANHAFQMADIGLYN